MRVTFFIVVMLVASPAFAETTEAGPGDDVEGIINQLQPGDELVLADGTYTLTERFSFDIAGTKEQPIVIRAADGATPHFDRPEANQNIWDVTAEWVEIRGLKFTGGSAGLRFEAARDVTVDGCEIADTADVALRMNGSGQDYERMTITNNRIHDTGGTGEGMYLGCNDDDCRISNSLVAGNYVHHTNADDVSQGDGIEIKEGSFGNVVRDNVIHDTNYPCIITYATAGNGGENVIERNVMWNCGDHGIQSAADATIRNNIVMQVNNTGIAMQPHQSGAPSNLRVVHNTVINDGAAIAVRGAAGEVIVANNAVYSQAGDAVFVNGDTGLVTAAGNVGEGNSTVGGVGAGDIAADFVAASYDMSPLDVFPAPDSALVGAGEGDFSAPDDFNGVAREGAVDVGAYAFVEGGNPGWSIGPGFKDATASPPETANNGAGNSSAGNNGAGNNGAGTNNSTSGENGAENNDTSTNDGVGSEAADNDESCAAAGGDAPSGLLLFLFALIGLRRIG